MSLIFSNFVVSKYKVKQLKISSSCTTWLQSYNFFLTYANKIGDLLIMHKGTKYIGSQKVLEAFAELGGCASFGFSEEAIEMTECVKSG